jgi:hypothetical protein
LSNPHGTKEKVYIDAGARDRGSHIRGPLAVDGMLEVGDCACEWLLPQEAREAIDRRY